MRPEVRRGRTRGFVMGVIGMIPEVTLLPMVCIKPWAGGLPRERDEIDRCDGIFGMLRDVRDARDVTGCCTGCTGYSGYSGCSG
jgi:hypothetical protein